MPRARKRPIEVETVLYVRDAPDAALSFCNSGHAPCLVDAPFGVLDGSLMGHQLWVQQSQTWISLDPEHWIIREPTDPDAYYPCTVESYEATYETLED